jgi:hypothetical protein
MAGTSAVHSDESNLKNGERLRKTVRFVPFCAKDARF